jgi:excisionase family DNA binding protein
VSTTTSLDDRLAFGPADAARAIGISRAHLYIEIAAGKIATRKLGSRTLILRDELDRYLQELPPGPGRVDGDDGAA